MPFSVTAGAEPVAGYRIIRKLGQGGFGEVWEAEAPGGVRVAMKIIRLESSQAKPELRALEIVRNIRHPHLLDIHFSVTVEDVIVIAMPLCDQSLWDRLKECKDEGRPGLPRDELLGYMEELAKAVDYLNEPRHPTPDGQRIGIQHRDIKPHNVFLVGGCVRLADFGLAKFLQDSLASHTGSMSPNYVAPEALEGTVAPQSDQYSMAVTYIQLRTGKLPVTGQTISQIIYNHLKGSPDLSHLPEGERPILARALSREPGARWPNCQTFVAHLRQAIRISTGEEPGMATPCGAGAMTTEPHPRPADTLVVTGQSRPPNLSATEHETGSATYTASGSKSATRSGSTSVATGSRVATDTQSTVTDASRSGSGSGSGWRSTQTTPETKKGLPLALIAGPVGVVIAAVVLFLVLRPKDESRGSGGGSKIETLANTPTSPIPATETTPKVPDVGKPSADTPPIPPVVRSIVRFEPPTARVLIDGKRRNLNDSGEVTLEFAGDSPIELVASADGYRDLKKPLHPRDLKPPANLIQLEPQPVSPAQLAIQARDLLRNRCHDCHGIDFQIPGLDVLDRDALVTKSRPDGSLYVVPGDPGASVLWTVIGIQGHPNLGPKPLSESEKTTLRRWIETGAALPERERREFREEGYVLTAIRDALRKTPEEDRKSRRFFTFANLSNNPRIDSEELPLARAGLAKLLNSLSWKRTLARPTPIDKDRLVLSIDLRDYGWSKGDLWNEILKSYPYGMTHASNGDPLHTLDDEVHTLSNEDLPYVRADWFLATASRPPLYHALLELPRTAGELEQRLQVDRKLNYLQNKVVRAGLARGRVSGRNQVFERHAGTGGPYWTTYDFRVNQARGDIFRYPLGPDLDETSFPQQSFASAGSGILFSLPNGLQAYMLVDGEGKRIDTAPAETAHDPLLTSGSPDLVNGLSCIACHRQGIFPLKDEVRRRTTLTGPAREKVMFIYPEPAEMEGLCAEDRRRFMDAVEEVASPFLGDGRDRTRTMLDVPEPIGALARRFGNVCHLEDVASELGLRNPADVQAKVKLVPRLRKLGLEPLIAGKPIAREVLNNTFDQLVIELDVGTPHRSF